MPKSKLQTLYIVIFFILLAAEIITLIEDPTNIALLIKGAILLVSYVIAITSLYRRRRSVIAQHYDKKYRDTIGSAFVNDKTSRKKLMDAIILYNSDRYNAAVAKLDQLRKRCACSADHSAVLTFRALCFSERNLDEEAVRTYEELLKYDGQNSHAWSNLGVIHKKYDRMDAAEEAFRNAIRANDQNAYAYTNLASLLIDVEENEEALEYLKKALQLDPTLRTALGFAYIACVRLEETNSAEEYLQRYISAGGDKAVLDAALSD